MYEYYWTECFHRNEMGGGVEKGWLDLSEKHAETEQEALAVFAMKATENKHEVQKESCNS